MEHELELAQRQRVIDDLDKGVGGKLSHAVMPMLFIPVL